jgi:predicted alpha/beta-hydrolase family hydrolase
LVLISYPLHPPGKPDTLRVDHFSALKVPCLFVSGTKDPFGAPAELERHAEKIPGPVTHVWIEGGGHDFKRHDDDVAEKVRDWLRGLGRRGAQ